MPEHDGTTRRQTLFLRAFRNNPAGPPPDAWPSPAILRKWLRKPPFRRALCAVQEALRFQTDFHLANAATQAAKRLSTVDAELTTQDLNRLLRHAHLRQRFAATASADAATDSADDAQSTGAHDNRLRHASTVPAGKLTNAPAPTNAPPPARLPPGVLPKIPLETYILMGRGNHPIWIGDKSILDRIVADEHYAPPLHRLPDFPDPADGIDSVYRNLLQNTQALLWFMHLYDTNTKDHRFQPILLACKHLVPREPPPGHTYPKFQTIPPTTPNSQPATNNSQLTTDH